MMSPQEFLSLRPDEALREVEQSSRVAWRWVTINFWFGNASGAFLAALAAWDFRVGEWAAGVVCSLLAALLPAVSWFARRRGARHLRECDESLRRARENLARARRAERGLAEMN